MATGTLVIFEGSDLEAIKVTMYDRASQYCIYEQSLTIAWAFRIPRGSDVNTGRPYNVTKVVSRSHSDLIRNAAEKLAKDLRAEFSDLAW